MEKIIDLKDFSEFKELCTSNKIAALIILEELVNLDSPTANATLIVLAEKIGEEIRELKTLDKKFKSAKICTTDSVTKTIAEFNDVIVRFPYRPKKMDEKFMIQFSPDKEKIEIVAISSHYFSHPFLKRLENGYLTTAVAVNFFNVPEEKRGKTITGKVIIKLKKNLMNKITELVIDVYYTPMSKRPTKKLVIGCELSTTETKNEEYQTPIPEILDKCVKIERI